MMNQKEMNMQICRAYIRDKWKAMGLYILIVTVFYAVAFLYHYDQVRRNMVYAVEITVFFGILAVLADYRSYHIKCRGLLFLLQKEEERTRFLSEAKNFPDSLFTQLLVEEEQAKRKSVTKYDEKQKEMADYYTMWTHQIKTPIAALRLLLQNEDIMLAGEQQRSGNEERKEGQERRCQEELFKIEQYAQMALCFARLDSPSSDFLFKDYDVYEIVKQAVRKYSVLFLGSGLSFRMEEFEIRAVTDEKWLGFVVEQVFSNALKYTYQGGIAIYGADADGSMRSGKASYLVIEDTGIGIRESDLPRIFERGFTGYNGRLDRKSTGIGLYLCDRIMGRMAHAMRVVSVPGEGTKVILGFVQE